MSEKNRLYYMDILRIIATVFVIVIHICVINWYHIPTDSFDWKVLNICESVSQVAVPIFFMISGALFLDESKSISIKDLYKKNILRLFIAFVFWSILYALISKPVSLSGFILNVVKGHFHLWFIPAIIGCYMIVPFLREIVKSKKLLKYYLILAIIFTFTLNYIIPILINSDINYIAYFGNLLKTAVSNLVFRFTLGYSAYFALGYFLCNAEFSKTLRRVIYLMGISALMATVCFSYVASVNNQKPVDTYYSKTSLNIMIEACALFVFAKYNLSPKSLKEKTVKRLLFASKCTFGIYLIHPIFIKIIEKYLHISAVTFNPLLAVPAFTITVFVLSFAASALLNKIPFVKKYIV